MVVAAAAAWRQRGGGNGSTAAVAAAVGAWRWRGFVVVAYVVSDEKDYPNNMVFTKNMANTEKLNAAKKKKG